MGYQKRFIYGCDIGSTLRGNFAWVRCEPGEDVPPIGDVTIKSLIKYLLKDFEKRCSVSLGFESPLFLPIPKTVGDLCKGREGEGDRSMFAPAGGYVTTLGIHLAAWILREIRNAANQYNFTTDSLKWPPPDGKQIFFCWEAFVSGSAKSRRTVDEHIRDAATAAIFFQKNENRLGEVNAVKTAQPLSLIHAIALWSGWSTEIKGLHEPVLVIKPEQPYHGTIIIRSN